MMQKREESVVLFQDETDEPAFGGHIGGAEMTDTEMVEIS